MATWYDDGLNFTCQRCGNCCTGTPGHVWCTPEEIAAMADLIGEDLDVFSRSRVRRVGPGYSLLEQANGDCTLWDREQGCLAYQARPVQCRTWPFWPELLETRQAFEAEARECAGIREGLEGGGTYYSYSQIEDTRRQAQRSDPTL